MLRMAAPRVSFLALTMVIMSALVFLATRALPGDAATQTLGIYAGWERVQTYRQQIGQDRSPWRQYLTWTRGLLHGDLGRPVTYGERVAGLGGDAVGRSRRLAVNTTILATVLGIG